MDLSTRSPGADAPYWHAIAQGHLELPRCQGCQRWHWPAVWRCGACGSWDHAWQNIAPAGKIFTWTRTWHTFGGNEELAHPFISVVVSLDNADVRLTGLLALADHDPVIGMPVTATISHRMSGGREIPFLQWIPIQESTRPGASI